MQKPTRADALKPVALDREALLASLEDCRRRKLHATHAQSSGRFDEMLNTRLCEIIAEWGLSDLNHGAHVFISRSKIGEWKKQGRKPSPQPLLLLCAYLELTGHDISHGLVVTRSRATNNYGFAELDGARATRNLNHPFSLNTDVYDVFIGQIRLAVQTGQINPEDLPTGWVRADYIDQKKPVGSFSISVPRVFIEVKGFDPSIVKDFMRDEVSEERGATEGIAEDVLAEKQRRDGLRKDLVYAVNLQPGVRKPDQGYCDGGFLAWRLAIKQWELKATGEGEYPLASANEVRLCRVSAITGSFADLTIWAEAEEISPKLSLNKNALGQFTTGSETGKGLETTRRKILEQVLKQRHIEGDRQKLSSARLFFE